MESCREVVRTEFGKPDILPFELKSLAYLFLNDVENGYQFATNLAEVEPRQVKSVKGSYKGHAKSLQAIAQGNHVVLLEGLERMLMTFKRRINNFHRMHFMEIPLCVEVTTLIILADRHGVSINVERDIPDKLVGFLPSQDFFQKKWNDGSYN